MLDEKNNDEMYIAGRAMAVCEAAIIDAGMMVPIAATHLVGTDPAEAFVKMHAKFLLALAKLRMDGRSTSVARYEAQISALMGRLTPNAVPDGLRVEAQSPLHIGYWHQRSAMNIAVR